MMIYDMSTGQPVEISRPDQEPGVTLAADPAPLPALRLQEVISEPQSDLRFPPDVAFTDLTEFLKQ